MENEEGEDITRDFSKPELIDLNRSNLICSAEQHLRYLDGSPAQKRFLLYYKRYLRCLEDGDVPLWLGQMDVAIASLLTVEKVIRAYSEVAALRSILVIGITEGFLASIGEVV